MNAYPEHEKIKALGGENQLVGNFIEWLGETGYVIAQYNRSDQLFPARASTQDLLADYFEIDQAKLEEEKRAMLESLRTPT